MKRYLGVFFLCAASIANCIHAPAAADELKKPSSERQQLFSPSLGVEFRAVGAAFLQDAPKTEWPISVMMGAAIEVEFLSIGRNRIGVAGAYTHFFGGETDGSAQINVETGRQQVDILLAYRFHWTFVSLFAHAGASVGIFSSTTRVYDIGPASISSDGESYVLDDRKLVTEEKHTGGIWGPVCAVGGGLDVGRIATHFRRKLDNFLFWNFYVQYEEHNLRHEVGLWTSLSVYPMNFRKK